MTTIVRTLISLLCWLPLTVTVHAESQEPTPAPGCQTLAEIVTYAKIGAEAGMALMDTGAELVKEGYDTYVDVKDHVTEADRGPEMP